MKHVVNALRDLNRAYWGKWFAYAFVVGVFTGCVGIIFQILIETLQHVSLVTWVGYHPQEAKGDHAFLRGAPGTLRVWWILPIISLGGLVTGLLVRWAPGAKGPGTDGAIDAFHNQRGIIPVRIPLVKVLASAITIGTGGSAGREGPIAQIGAGIGSYFAQRWQLSAHDRRILLAMGMGAGVGAIFRAPLAGTIFAGEIMYRDADIESEVIIPGAIAATVSYAVFQSSLPPESRFTPLFGELGQYEVGHVSELLPYTVLAFALVAASAAYIRTFHLTERVFRQLPLWEPLKPFAGACCTGLLVIAGYYALAHDENVLACLGSGYGFLQDAIGKVDQLPLRILLAVAALKMVTTSLTVGSGGSGGVFGPCLVIGGSVGAVIGKLFHAAVPGIVTQPGAYSIVGMAGLFAGCANAPFSTILMVSEMTGHYRLLVPTVWVSAIAFVLCRRWSLYGAQVGTRLDSPAHKGDFTIDLIEGMLVREVFQPRATIKSYREDASLDEIVHSLSKTAQRYFPVVDFDGQLVGIFSADDVRLCLYDELLWKVAIARDIMTEQVVSVRPDDDLNTALGRFTALNVDELPVVDVEDPNRILGFLRRKETIAAYTKRRLELQRQLELESR